MANTEDFESMLAEAQEDSQAAYDSAQIDWVPPEAGILNAKCEGFEFNNVIPKKGKNQGRTLGVVQLGMKVLDGKYENKQYRISMYPDSFLLKSVAGHLNGGSTPPSWSDQVRVLKENAQGRDFQLEYSKEASKTVPGRVYTNAKVLQVS